ncbi:MAG: pentapeptide repeat-containing protein, partial [Deltaproteobacteria bacterium]
MAVPISARAQIAGESINMVSGIQWPGGDPFLQRQNEPSIAVSSANPQHLLAGANDYRSVDVPFVTDATKMAADAWQGVFKSYDGGQTWKSTLMPGFPQDTSWDGTHSAVRGPAGEVLYNASADPVVRAGTDGMFYFGGIVFRRDTGAGRVVVNRFIDLNNKENGNPVGGTDSIQWVDAKVVDPGGAYFADKPWIAVDVPRAGALTCTVSRKDANDKVLFSRSFPGGALYAVWARIYSDTRADVMFSRSLDCGETWSAPLQLNDNKSQASQGVVASVDPRTGDVYVAWRRFGLPGATPPQAEEAIFVARTFSKGRKFTHPRLLTTFVPFEQAQDPTRLRFRTEAFPSLASSVDPSGTKSWTHVAWAQRAPNGDGQVVLSQVQVAPPPASNDEWDDPCDGWKIPAIPIDPAPVTDDAGNSFTRGHQFMPQLTFTQGRLVAVYYDSRLDHTRTYYRPYDPCLPFGTCWGPDSRGRWYTEERSPVGERALSPNMADWLDYVTGELDDTGLQLARHTVDVRVAIAQPAAQPVFRSIALSRLPFGSRGDEAPADADPYDPGRDRADTAKRPLSFGAAGHIDVVEGSATPARLLRLQDLQVNPPNLPMFKNGSVPFIGDYIDVQGPVFVRTATGWAFDTQPTASPVFHAVWTSNQDVVPPRDGDWKRYTPPGLGGGATSLVDPGKTVPACSVGYAGTRNQNIYTARISEGLFVSSPQNAKALGTSFLRNFVVSAVNATGQDRTFTFSLAQPPGAYASFRADGGTPLEQVTVRIPANSSAVQTVFMKLLSGGVNPATLFVNVNEVAPGTLAGSVMLNPPGLTFDLAQPEGTSASIAAGEVLSVAIGAANLSNANLSNANLSNANLSNANLSNANLSNANLSNANLSNATIDAAHLSNANLSNANLSNANLSNANLSNANLSNANLSNANLSNASITDLDYSVTNTGNTTQGFDVRL